MTHRDLATCPSILPPPLLQAVAEHGTPQQRARALHTLARDEQRRQARAQAAPGRRRSSGRGTPAGPRRTVSDAADSTQLPGRPARTEGDDPKGDPAVDEAYDGLGTTYGFYAELFGRDSIDGAGLPLLATVHYDKGYDNAFWDGQRMVFGDGDGELFGRFTASLEVIGHELSHGVTEVEAGLVYRGQSGALNESLSDVFGVLVKQRVLGQQAQEADWLIGADLLLPGVKGVALRSMAAPGTAYDDPVLGKDPQVGTLSAFVQTSEDNGGVHINSGIPNRAFYLLATQLGGSAWETAGRLWYEVLRDARLLPTCDFATFAGLTVAVAGGLPGAPPGLGDTVRAAWQGVEVKPLPV